MYVQFIPIYTTNILTMLSTDRAHDARLAHGITNRELLTLNYH